MIPVVVIALFKHLCAARRALRFLHSSVTSFWIATLIERRNPRPFEAPKKSVFPFFRIEKETPARDFILLAYLIAYQVEPPADCGQLSLLYAVQTTPSPDRPNPGKYSRSPGLRLRTPLRALPDITPSVILCETISQIQ